MESPYNNHEHDISKSEADKRIKVFLAIRDEIREKILKSTIAQSLSPEAKTYLESPYLSFAFLKDQLDDLCNSVPAANGLRVYLAAATPPIPPKVAPVAGTPTLVIYACKINPMEGPQRTVTNEIPNNELKAACQHPCPLVSLKDASNYDSADEERPCPAPPTT